MKLQIKKNEGTNELILLCTKVMLKSNLMNKYEI